MVKHFKELRTYREAFRLAQEIYTVSRGWPVEERYSLTDQIRRSSRSVCANIAEAWRKRRYPNHFVSKLTDADAEAAETQCWLDFAIDCGYLGEDLGEKLNRDYDKVVGGLVRMIQNADRWTGPAGLVKEEAVEYTFRRN